MATKERRGGRARKPQGADAATDTPTAAAGLRGLSYAGARERLAPASTAPDAEAEASWAEVLSGALVLEQGHSGPAVRLLQQKLAAAGHEIRPSGVFGPSTAALILAFQGSQDIDEDARVDARTAAALDAI